MAMFLACTGGGCRAARLAFTTFSFQSVITSALAVLVSPTSKVPIKYMLVVSFILASISLKVTQLTSYTVLITGSDFHIFFYWNKWGN